MGQFWSKERCVGKVNDGNITEYSFDKLTAERQREIASMGGKASAEARKEKARLRKVAEQLMDMPIVGKDARKMLLAMGFTDKELTNDKVILLGLFKASMKGNVEAFREFKKLLGEEDSPNNETLERLDEVLARIEGNI